MKYNDIVTKLQDVKLQNQNFFSETSEFFTPIQCLCDIDRMFVSFNLPPDTSADLVSREIVVSSDLAPDLDPV